MKDEKGLGDDDVKIIKKAFESQRLKFSALLEADELAMTDADLEEYGIAQGGLRKAILSLFKTLRQ